MPIPLPKLIRGAGHVVAPRFSVHGSMPYRTSLVTTVYVSPSAWDD